MNRDEILNMPAGREMDALVAEKVMGWVRYSEWYWTPETGKRWQWQLYVPDFNFGDLDGRFYKDGDERSGIYDIIVPKYSTDIMWAWEVVEKVGLSIIKTEKGYYVGVYDDFFDTLTGVIDGHFGGGYSGRKDIYNEDSQAPLAICRAALLATLEKD